MRNKLMRIPLLILLAIVASLVAAEGRYISPELTAPALKGKTKPIILPEKILREYDPITILFPNAVGPSNGGPEDFPEKFVKSSFSFPGEYQWIDNRTLVFRPASSWPGYRTITLQIGDVVQELNTFLAEPLEISPRKDSENLDDLGIISIRLKDQLDDSLLKEIFSLEVRPLPGLGKEKALFLTSEDYDIKKADGGNQKEGYVYSIVIRKPVDSGKRVLLHMRLTRDASLQDAEAVFSFSTRPDFTVTRVSLNGSLPIGNGGATHSMEMALVGNTHYQNRLGVEFSSYLPELSFAQVKGFVRFTPSVEDFKHYISGSTLYVYGKFKQDVLYRVDLVPGNIVDNAGRPLKMDRQSSFYMTIPKKPGTSRWKIGEGIVELHGPKQIPMSSASMKKLDLRIYKVNPLDRRIWPFPESPVDLAETQPVPRPGEEPANEDELSQNFERGRMLETIRMLGSPAFSRVVDLPLEDDALRYEFGLDVAPFLSELERGTKPGTYLVGYRPIDSGAKRSYVRIQVTDLGLSMLEESDKVVLFVTSLKNALPVSGAEIRIEARDEYGKVWKEAFKLRTDAKGMAVVPKTKDGYSFSYTRIIVSKDEDMLVLNPETRMPVFRDNYWDRYGYESWVYALNRPYSHERAQEMAFSFCERPIYKPEEPVYIKGYVRSRAEGVFFGPDSKLMYTYIIDGPGGKRWKFPVKMDGNGSFNLKFEEKDLPTGSYYGRLESGSNPRNNGITFRKEAYKIPSFEVNLIHPKRVPSDRAFTVDLTASYYAGGKVSGQPVTWRITEFPFAYVPQGRQGYLFSSDSRYNRRTRYSESRGGNTRFGTTDDEGNLSVNVDPSLLGDTMPKQYIVEATVTGADEQTVTATGEILCLPPFILGLKAERFVKKGLEIPYSFVALDVKNDPVDKLPVKVKLIKREWRAYFVESDLSTSAPKYRTESVDTVISESVVTNTSKEFASTFKVSKSGIYLIELEAHDKLGRIQSVMADIYVAGDEAVTWDKPIEDVLDVVLDKPSGYVPGEKASLLVRSPFPEGRLLVIVEKPTGTDLTWLDVVDNKAVFEIPISADQVPNLPVTLLYMSPRLKISGNSRGLFDELERPHTLGKTLNLRINPVENQVKVKLVHPEQGMPGKDLDMEIQLSDNKGNPLAGEVTLWLVDQAVLSLGHEMELDPLKLFITDYYTRIRFMDMRSKILGSFRTEENPGGGAAEMMSKMSILDKATVRKNFRTVAYYMATLKVDSSGKVKLAIPMPDNLTVFQIRAVASSGLDRFGVGKSSVAMRLPLLVEPSLPRFVRYGDEIRAGGIGRKIVGPDGEGQARIRVKNGTVTGTGLTNLQWKGGKSEKLLFPVVVDKAILNDKGRMTNSGLEIEMAISRISDEASDAFSITIPIREDRPVLHWQIVTNFTAPGNMVFKPFGYAPQKETVRGEIVLTSQMGILNTLGGVEYLLEYPHGCLEQKISKAYCAMALQGVYNRFNLSPLMPDVPKIHKEAMDAIIKSQGSDGLFGYWPGSQTYVYLSSYVMEYLCEARKSGLTVDNSVMEKLAKALRRSLRSDYSGFVDYHDYQERVLALKALAQYGHYDSGYADDFARTAYAQSLEARAITYLTLRENKHFDPKLMSDLKKDLWNNMTFTLRDGKEFFSGIQFAYSGWGGIINSYEISAMANVYRGLSYGESYQGKLKMIGDRLISLYGKDGWGNTATTSSVLLAFRDTLMSMNLKQSPYTLSLKSQLGSEQVKLEKESISISKVVRTNIPLELSCQDKINPEAPPYIRYKVSYLPDVTGDKINSLNEGFVVSKEIIKVSTTQAPDSKSWIKSAGTEVDATLGSVVEEHLQVVNPADRYFVAVICPIAAGWEPLNPNLLTSPPEARPSRSDTLEPTYVQFLDDKVCYYYNYLPKGTYDFHFRVKVMTAGSFVEPPAYAEMMYEQSVRGNTPGLRLKVSSR